MVPGSSISDVRPLFWRLRSVEPNPSPSALDAQLDGLNVLCEARHEADVEEMKQSIDLHVLKKLEELLANIEEVSSKQ